jgi:NAD(P)-dependent dehydrogenase (short-subunit alcohol dehydrogenase family)
VARVLAEEGADIAAFDISQENANRVAEDARRLGRRAIGIGTDLTSRRRCEEAVKNTLDTFGQLHILVNVVGGLGKVYLSKPTQDFVDITEEEWDEVWSLNVKSHVFMCQAVTPHFVEQRYGKIVNMSSTGGQNRALKNGQMSYSVSKAANIRFTRNLALSLAEFNINVNNVQPGRVYTPTFYRDFFQHEIDLHPEKYEGKTPEQLFDEMAVPTLPMQKAQTPEDIGHAIAFMVSDRAHNITGQCLNIDAGVSLL